MSNWVMRNGQRVTSNEYRAAMPKLKVSRSKVIAEALVAHREREEVAAEGYRFYAQEASEFAAASLQAFSDVLGHGDQTTNLAHDCARDPESTKCVPLGD